MKILHPLLVLIASAADRQLARYVEFLKEENKILRTRIKGHPRAMQKNDTEECIPLLPWFE